MRVILEMTPEKYGKIRRLVADGKYEGISQFADAAIENQLHLESLSALDKGSTLDQALGLGLDLELKVPPPSESAPPSFATISPVEEPDTSSVELDYLWMMMNRFLPLKVTIRAIASSLSKRVSNHQWADLGEAKDECLKAAIEAGKTFQVMDKGRKSSEKLAIGFPSGRDEKSQSRFSRFYVGEMGSDATVKGAPAILRFVNIVKESSGKTMIGITRAGLQFAQLTNPAIDSGDYLPLSEEEVEFLWSHITRVLPRERRLMLRVLEAVSQGRNTPVQLTEPVKSLLDVNLAEIISQRASLVSRLAEMGLLVRKKNGLYVTYNLTDRGSSKLSSESQPVAVEN